MRFPDAGELLNPGPPARHPKTGNTVPGPPVATPTVAVLQQLQTTEAADGTTTVLAGWRLLLPPDAPVTARSRWRAADGRVFDVAGDPAPIATGAGIPSHISVALTAASDLQEAP